MQKCYSLTVVTATTVNDLNDLKYTLSSMYHEVLLNKGEIIIVVDGGIDDEKAVKEFSLWLNLHGYESDLIILKKEKSGLTKSLNFGIKNANSNFIFRIDSGDVWLEGRVAKQLPDLKEGYELVATTSLSTKKHTQKKLIEILKLKNHIIHSSAAFKKIYYNEYFDVCQDYELWLRLVKQNKKIKLHSDPVCFRIDTADGISFKKTFKQLNTSFIIRNKNGLSIGLNLYLCSISYLKVIISKLRMRLFRW